MKNDDIRVVLFVFCVLGLIILALGSCTTIFKTERKSAYEMCVERRASDMQKLHEDCYHTCAALNYEDYVDMSFVTCEESDIPVRKVEEACFCLDQEGEEVDVSKEF